MERNEWEEAVIYRALDYVKTIFEGESSGHDSYHTIRVYRTANRIAKEMGANRFVVSLASLLHDVDDIKLFPQNRNDENARAFLTESKIASDQIDVILSIIHEVSFKGTDSVKPSTLEGEIVQDADRLDAIGAIGIARAFAYGGSHHRPLYIPGEKYKQDMNEEEYRKNQSSTIAHFYEKLLLLEGMMNTKPAKKIAKERTEVLRSFLEEFYEEWDGRR